MTYGRNFSTSKRRESREKTKYWLGENPKELRDIRVLHILIQWKPYQALNVSFPWEVFYQYLIHFCSTKHLIDTGGGNDCPLSREFIFEAIDDQLIRDFPLRYKEYCPPVILKQIRWKLKSRLLKITK